MVRSWLSAAFWILSACAMTFWFGRLTAPRPPEGECSCGRSEPCAFGPGIVGVRKCETGLWPRLNRWSTCEPDPRYRVGP